MYIFFGVNCIDCLLADREFVRDKWIGFLNEHRIRYFIRIRENFLIFCPKKNKKLYAWNFFNNLKPYQGYHYDRIMQYKGEYCYLPARLSKVIVCSSRQVLRLPQMRASSRFCCNSLCGGFIL